MFPLRKMFAKFTRLKFQKFHHLIKFNMTLKFQKFHHFWNKFSKIWKKPWYFTIWTNHFVFSLLLLRRHIPKAKMLSFRYTCIKKFNPVKFFDTFLIIKHVVTKDINTHRIVSNSNIRDSEVKFFLDLVLNALCKRKKKKKRWIVVSRRKPKNESSFEVRESQPRSLWRKYCTASSSVNRTNKDEISLPKSCNAVLIFYWSTALLLVRLYQVQLTKYVDIVIIMFITALVSTIKNVLINRESKEKTNNERSLHGHIFLYILNKHTWR